MAEVFKLLLFSLHWTGICKCPILQLLEHTIVFQFFSGPGNYGDWSPWSSCSQSCAGGVQSQQRINPCVASPDVRTRPCGVEGGFPAWYVWHFIFTLFQLFHPWSNKIKSKWSRFDCIIASRRSQRFILRRYNQNCVGMFYHDVHLRLCAKIFRKLGMQLFSCLFKPVVPIPGPRINWYLAAKLHNIHWWWHLALVFWVCDWSILPMETMLRA